MVFSNKIGRPLGLVLRIALGGIFIYAGWLKLREPWELFALAINSYDLLPLKAVELVARTLPWVELLTGALLISGLWLRVATTVMSLLLVVFFCLMVRAFVKGMEISCGCFGPGEVISWRTLLRDGSLLAGSLILTWMAFLQRRKTV